MKFNLLLLTILWILPTTFTLAAEFVIAEGEQFRPLDDKGWAVTHQDDSWASHTYGGMWVSNGGLMGAPANSVGSVAVQQVTIPVAGRYRVWSRSTRRHPISTTCIKLKYGREERSFVLMFTATRKQYASGVLVAFLTNFGGPGELITTPLRHPLNPHHCKPVLPKYV